MLDSLTVLGLSLAVIGAITVLCAIGGLAYFAFTWMPVFLGMT